MSMTSVLINDNESIFPSPYTFNPDRWLPLKTEGKRLQRYLFAFGRGSRICVAMELEILAALAAVFRRFGGVMRLEDCVRERDIDTAFDLFGPISSREGNNLVVRFEKESR